MEEIYREYPAVGSGRMDEHTLGSATDKAEILRVLMGSKENGTSIGVQSPALGDGFIVTAVEDIILDEAETTIVFKPFDATGFTLPTNKLPLADIHSACPLASEFPNPVLRNIEKDKSWFF